MTDRSFFGRLFAAVWLLAAMGLVRGWLVDGWLAIVVFVLATLAGFVALLVHVATAIEHDVPLEEAAFRDIVNHYPEEHH
jgi:uncharacterized membrane protein